MVTPLPPAHHNGYPIRCACKRLYYGNSETCTEAEDSVMCSPIRTHHPASVINNDLMSFHPELLPAGPITLKDFDSRYYFIHKYLCCFFFFFFYCFSSTPIPHQNVPWRRTGIFFFFFFGLFCSLLYIQHVVRCLAHSRYLINLYSVNSWVRWNFEFNTTGAIVPWQEPSQGRKASLQ